MKLSLISSHYAGMLKAHAMPREQAFAYEAIMTLANTLENQEKEIDRLRNELAKLDERTIRAQRIG